MKPKRIRCRMSIYYDELSEDTNMSNYMYVFKDSSLIEKAETETTSKCVNKIYQGIKEERVDLNESEINFLYASH